MRNWKKSTIVLAAAAIALTGSVGVGSAMAYFTTYSEAEGSVEMNMGFTTTVPNEKVDENGKHVTIENTGDYDCFVRVKAFAPSNIELSYEGDGWTEGTDGYWYYDSVLAAGATSSELNVKYTFPSDETEEFNVVVVEECTPVVYDADGNAIPDWDYVITSDDTE